MWVGPTLKFGYYAQELEGLNPDNEIIDEIWELCPQQTPGEVRSFLGKFLFSGDDVFKRVGSLSGGEQSRVLLAKLLLTNANVLLLDEPTNHLDIPAREALEASLAEYPATLFIISHDRYLLNNLATKLLIFDGSPEEPQTFLKALTLNTQHSSNKHFKKISHRVKTFKNQNPCNLLNRNVSRNPSANGK